MKKKRLQTLVQRALKACFKKNKVDQVLVRKFASSFGKLSLGESIYALTLFKRGLGRLIDEQTLLIEAPVQLSRSDIKKIVKKFNSTFYILNSKFLLNPSLLGGLKLKIGDQVFDDTLKNRIDELKLELSK